MKFVIIFALVAIVVANPNYGRYDNFDLDEVMLNDRLFAAYVQCFLDKGKCTPEGADLKKSVPNAIETGCSNCSEKEKHHLAKVIKFCKEKHPEDWDQLNNILNPGGKYNANLNEILESYSV